MSLHMSTGWLLLFCLSAYGVVYSDDRGKFFQLQEEGDILRVGTNTYCRVFGFELSEHAKRKLAQYQRIRNIRPSIEANPDGFFALLSLKGKDLYVEQLGDGYFKDYYYSVLSGTATTQTNYLVAKFGSEALTLPVRASWFCGTIFIGNPCVSDLSKLDCSGFHFTNGVLNYVDICVALTIINPE